MELLKAKRLEKNINKIINNNGIELGHKSASVDNDLIKVIKDLALMDFSSKSEIKASLKDKLLKNFEHSGGELDDADLDNVAAGLTYIEIDSKKESEEW